MAAPPAAGVEEARRPGAQHDPEGRAQRRDRRRQSDRLPALLEQRASDLRAGFRGQRRAELGYVIGVVRRLAQGKQPRRAAGAALPDPRPQPRVVGEGGAAGSGRAPALRRQPRDLPVLPGQGPAAPSARATSARRTATGTGTRNSDLRSLLDDLVRSAVERGGLPHLGVLLRLRRRHRRRGSPGWRRARRCRRSRARAAAQRSRSASRSRSARAGASSAARRSACARRREPDDWYRALQLRAAAERPERDAPGRQRPAHLRRDLAATAAAQQLFEAGDRTARARDRRSYDTGAWSLYNRPGGQPGHGGEPQLPHAQPRLRPQPLQGDQGGRRTARRPTTSRTYLKEDPTLDPLRRRALARRARGKGVRFRFKLSKIGARRDRRQGRRERAARYLSHQRAVRARRALLPLGPAEARSASAPTRFTLFARDLAGNSSHARRATCACTGSASGQAGRRGVESPGDDAPHDPLHGQGRGRQDERRRGDRARDRAQRACAPSCSRPTRRTASPTRSRPSSARSPSRSRDNLWGQEVQAEAEMERNWQAVQRWLGERCSPTAASTGSWPRS